MNLVIIGQHYTPALWGATSRVLASVPEARGSVLQVQLMALMKRKLISDWLLCGLRERSGSFRLTLLDDGKEEAVAS